MERRIDEARLAMLLLTRLPVGRLRDPVPELSDAVWAFPLAGIPVAVLGWSAQHLMLACGLGPLSAALVSLAMMAGATGALHHDALADFFDGIGGGNIPTRRLEIMKDSRIGSFGALALVFAILLPASAMAHFPSGVPLGGFCLIAVASRLAMLGSLFILPPVKEDGLGSTASGAMGLAWLPGTLVVLALVVLVDPSHGLVLVGMAGAGILICRIAKSLLGGQTGDVLGSVQLSAEVSGWLGLAALW